MNRVPDKSYKYKGYNVGVYYGDKKYEDVIKELVELKTNEFIRKLSKNI